MDKHMDKHIEKEDVHDVIMKARANHLSDDYTLEYLEELRKKLIYWLYDTNIEIESLKDKQR